MGTTSGHWEQLLPDLVKFAGRPTEPEVAAISSTPSAPLVVPSPTPSPDPWRLFSIRNMALLFHFMQLNIEIIKQLAGPESWLHYSLFLSVSVFVPASPLYWTRALHRSPGTSAPSS